jgi:hypothetical protein
MSTMRTLLISYDLGQPETAASYRELIAAIKALGDWAKPLKSEWFVLTGLTASVVRDRLKRHLDANDRLMIIELKTSDWATVRLPTDVTDWMQSHV